MQHGGIAADREEGRGVVDDLEMGRIVRLAERDEAGADARGGGDLPLRFRAGVDPQRPRRAATPRQLRQRRERRTGATAVIDEGTEGARPDILAADEAQPVEPLAVAQTYRFAVRHKEFPGHCRSMAVRRRGGYGVGGVGDAPTAAHPSPTSGRGGWVRERSEQSKNPTPPSPKPGREKKGRFS